MTVREAYEKLGEDYEDMMYRINENMLLRLLDMLLKDRNYADICQALKRRDYETAFRGAHTLKGVALNLGLTCLAEKAGALTEALRGRRDNKDISPAFDEFDRTYQNMNAIFTELLASSGGTAK